MTRRVRNSAVVAAVLLVFGVAAADALRDVVPERAAKDDTHRNDTTTAPETATPGRFIPVDGGRGTLVFTDPRDCRVREIAVGSATEYPLARTRGTCRLWVPPYGARIAYGVGDAADGGSAFRFLDLNHPEEEFETEFTADGRITWSFDGQRATWCERDDEGVDFEFYAERRLLDACSTGYLDTGHLVFTDRNLVLAGARSPAQTLVAARAPVDEVSIGVDGSVGVLAARRLTRYVRGRLTHSAPLPDVQLRRPPSFAPDNCGVLVFAPGQVRLVDLCLGHGPGSWTALDADWSPDGEWVVVNSAEGILFRRVVGNPREVLWTQHAAELGWRGHVEPTG